MLELYEISNHIMLSQSNSSSSSGERLGLHRLFRNDEYLSDVIHFDACLDRWEAGVPNMLRIEECRGDGDPDVYRQAAILHLR